MNCSVCGRGPTRASTTTLTLESGPARLVVRGVPVEVCPACGEEHLDDRVAVALMKRVQAAASGAAEQTLDYAAG